MARGWKFSASDGKKLYLYRWKPDTDDAKAAVLICHGMAEHAERYDYTASKLVEAGYAVYAADIRGHGKSVETEEGEVFGFFAEENGWDRIVEDQKEIAEKIRDEYPDTPIFLLGHSMGSFIARTLMFTYPEYFAGVILSGTAGNPGIKGFFGRMLARRAAAGKGAKEKSQKMHDMTFGAYNNAFKPVRTEFDWLSRDEEQVDAYVEDPMCGFVCTASLFRDLLDGLQRIHDRKNIQQIPKNLPVLLISGSQDPVGGAGKGVQQVHDLFQQHGMQDLSMKLYEGARHELFNETNRDEVIQHVLDWMNGHLES